MPDNKTISFPLKLFNIPKYKQQYEHAKAGFIAQYSDGEQRSLKIHFDWKAFPGHVSIYILQECV